MKRIACELSSINILTSMYMWRERERRKIKRETNILYEGDKSVRHNREYSGKAVSYR